MENTFNNTHVGTQHGCKAWSYLLAAAAAAITFVVYIPSLRHGFVKWDDPGYVSNNDLIHSLDIRFLKTIFTTSINYNWHPLTMISYALDYSVWGADPFGYHLVNIILHALNSGLIFVLTWQLLRASGRDPVPLATSAGLVAALLFGLHPLHVESVTWISERKDVLSGLFFISSVLAYLKYAQPGGGRTSYFYALSLVLFVLALLSKPMAITLPMVLLILDYYPLERLNAGNLIRVGVEKLPFFALVVFSSLITVWAQQEHKGVMPMDVYPLTDRIAVALRAYVFYLYKTVLPVGLSPYYIRPLRVELLSLYTLGSAFCLAVVSAFCLLTARSKKVFAASWLYYIITLIPVIGIVQVGGQAVADRYMYLPSISLFVLTGVGFGFLFEKVWDSRARIAAALVAALIIFSALSTLSVRQQAIWKDHQTLWYAGLKNVITAYFNRAYAYQGAGYYEEAIGYYNMAVILDPNHFGSYINRGISYMELGNLEAAVVDLNKAAELDPGNPLPYYNLSRLYRKSGAMAYSTLYLNKARELGHAGREEGE
jgi:tetratricopeptide (TPR) repeat protein